MARPKSFDRDEALDKAMELFWKHGYQTVTVTRLREELGIGHQSFYDTFSDKAHIFDEAVDRYVTHSSADVERMMNKKSGFEGIRQFFYERIELWTTGSRRGCLIINSTLELEPHNSVASAKIHKGLMKIEKGIRTALESAKERGEIGNEIDTNVAATFLKSQIAGLTVLARDGATKRQLTAIADHSLASVSAST